MVNCHAVADVQYLSDMNDLQNMSLSYSWCPDTRKLKAGACTHALEMRLPISTVPQLRPTVRSIVIIFTISREINLLSVEYIY